MGGISTRRFPDKSPERNKKLIGALIQAPLWQALTVYAFDTVVRHSNGQLMICAVAGTSLASEPTFSSTALIVEPGGPSWAWLGLRSELAADYDIPTVSISTTIPTNATLNTFYDSAIPGSVQTLAITNGGTGYVDGTYTNVPLTGGAGTGATAQKIVVTSGVVTSITIFPEGTGSDYLYGNTLSVDNANLGGSGSGLVLTATALWQNSRVSWALQKTSIKTSIVSNVCSRALVLNAGDNSAPVDYGFRTVEFITDDPWVGIAFHNSSGLSFPIYVDGYLLEENPSRLIAGNPCYYRISWNGIRKERHYRIILAGKDQLKGIAVLSQSTLRAPIDQKICGILYSDSFNTTISTYASQLAGYWLSFQIFHRLGFSNFKSLSAGGTGYIAGKASNDLNLTSGTFNCPTMISANPNTEIADDVRLVVFAHGLNDSASSDSDIANAALTAWTTARRQYRNALIVVFGPWSENSGPSAKLISETAALQSKFTEWNDYKSAFYSQETWTSGTGKWGSTTGIGNADFYIGADGTHPSFVGREYLINRMVEKLEYELKLRAM